MNPVERVCPEAEGIFVRPAMSTRQQKALGAYYTDCAVATFLTNWAIRDPDAHVLEPSFGGGVFLSAAALRITSLGGSVFDQLFGCELDQHTCDRFWESTGSALGLDRAKLVVGDFFTLSPPEHPFDAVVGNPPFVRYQSFSGDARRRALERAAQAGVRLTELSSSWAPFVVHASRFLRKGGRLAMVAPLELLHASYATPVLRFLASSFANTRLLTFAKRLFPELSQDTLLILADGYGQQSGGIAISFLHSVQDLTGADAADQAPTVDISRAVTDSAGFRPSLFRLPEEARSLYLRLAADNRLMRLAQVADVGIGYVTGANDFFHLSTADLAHWQIDRNDVLPAIRRGRDLSVAGLSLTVEDWQRLESAGNRLWLFHPQTAFAPPVANYIAHGEHLGVHKAYKCRARQPWWRVPWVMQPDLLMPVMVGEGPRLVANAAGVVATNTLHTVRLTAPISPVLLAAASLTTLTQLSAEIEGHALGGGMLKLEPSEAARLLLPCRSDTPIPSELPNLDKWVRAMSLSSATDLADTLFLRQFLGLRDSEILVLRDALVQLRTWRRQR